MSGWPDLRGLASRRSWSGSSESSLKSGEQLQQILRLIHTSEQEPQRPAEPFTTGHNTEVSEQPNGKCATKFLCCCED